MTARAGRLQTPPAGQFSKTARENDATNDRENRTEWAHRTLHGNRNPRNSNREKTNPATNTTRQERPITEKATTEGGGASESQQTAQELKINLIRTRTATEKTSAIGEETKEGDIQKK